MRRILSLCILSLALLPKAAHADTIDDFTLVGQGHTITYSLPASAIIMDHPHGVILSASAPATIDGVPGFNVSGQYYVPPLLNLPSVVINGLPLYGDSVLRVLAIIPVDNPSIFHPDDLLVSFVPGTYDLRSLPTNAPYNLTIATESVPTPEPSTFALLGTGLVSAIAAIRQRVGKWPTHKSHSGCPIRARPNRARVG